MGVSPPKVVLLLLSCCLVVSSQQCGNTYPTNFTATTHLKSNATYTLRIGIIGLASIVTADYYGLSFLANTINNDLSILPDVAIEIYGSFTTSDTSSAILASLYQITQLGVRGIIGGFTTSESRTIQQIAKVYAVPQIGYINVGSIMSNKVEYPYYLRTVPPDQIQIQGLVSFMTGNNWTKAIVIYSTDDYGQGYTGLVLAGAQKGISFVAIPVSLTITPAAVDPIMMAISKQIDDHGYRIIIYYCSLSPGMIMFNAMNATGYIGPKFVHIVTVAMTKSFPLLKPNIAYDGLFGWYIRTPQNNIYQAAIAAWNASTFPHPYFLDSSFFAMDALTSYAKALDLLMKNGTSFSSATSNLLPTLLNTSFRGTTGLITFNQNGDRVGDYELYNFNENGYNKVAIYFGLNDSFLQTKPYRFYGSNVAPPDSPINCECVFGQCIRDLCVCDSGYRGDSCNEKTAYEDTSSFTYLIPIIVILVLLGIIGYFVYLRKRRLLVEEVAGKQRSTISRAELNLHEVIGRGASGEVFKATFRGTEVAVKRIEAAMDSNFMREFELEVAIMCGLRHPNTILFMGSCFDPEKQETLLVMEYMAKGSLHDVLHDPKISLPYAMQLHLACQAAQGMNFLHQSTPPLIHSDLKSHNVLLDDKWNARISDFGITKLKTGDLQSGNGEAPMGTIYWTAPEVLAGGVATEKSDCYSFGIVLWEMFHRTIPFAGKDPVVIAVEIMQSGLRPPISSSTPEAIKALITSCWSQLPSDRPSFQEIMITLRALTTAHPIYTFGTTISRVEPPSGLVYLVNTDILDAFTIWEDEPRAMREAMLLHNQIIRHTLESYKGYEAAYHVNAFVAAFQSVTDAVDWCVAVQTALLYAIWPSKILAHKRAEPVKNDKGELIWNGLRVRMAVFSGVPNCGIDSRTGRMNYFGPILEMGPRMIRARVGGVVLVTNTVVENITQSKQSLAHKTTFAKCGKVSAQPGGKSEAIYKAIIDGMERLENTPRGEESGADLPQSVTITVDDGSTEGRPSTPSTPTGKKVAWIFSSGDVEKKEMLGKGYTGEHFSANWNKQTVAVKTLLNQKMKENDLLKLVADISIMRKIHHPNLLPCLGLCMEENSIFIMSEYMQLGNLKDILANPNIPLSLSKRVRIAQDIAQGLAFLSELPDEAMVLHDNLKSNNILIGKDWEVKIADYGQSSIKELARTMTSINNIAWTAPEVLNGEEKTYKIVTYSFGIILWELFTRQVPYADDEHPLRLVGKILSGYRPALSNSCPEMYKRLVTTCLDVDPDMRPSWTDVIISLSFIEQKLKPTD